MPRRHRRRDPPGLCGTPAMRTDVTPTTCRLGAAGGVFTAAFGARIRGGAPPVASELPSRNQPGDRPENLSVTVRSGLVHDLEHLRNDKSRRCAPRRTLSCSVCRCARGLLVVVGIKLRACRPSSDRIQMPLTSPAPCLIIGTATLWRNSIASSARPASISSSTNNPCISNYLVPSSVRQPHTRTLPATGATRAPTIASD